MDKLKPNLRVEFHGSVAVATLTDEKILDEVQLKDWRVFYAPD